MDIGYVWDVTKYEQVRGKHGVHFDEVVSTFDDPDGYEELDDSGEEYRYSWVGKTRNARLLVVIYTEEELPLLRLITAFEAEGRWIDEYQKRQGF